MGTGAAPATGTATPPTASPTTAEHTNVLKRMDVLPSGRSSYARGRARQVPWSGRVAVPPGRGPLIKVTTTPSANAFRDRCRRTPPRRCHLDGRAPVPRKTMPARTTARAGIIAAPAFQALAGRARARGRGVLPGLPAFTVCRGVGRRCRRRRDVVRRAEPVGPRCENTTCPSCVCGRRRADRVAGADDHGAGERRRRPSRRRRRAAGPPAATANVRPWSAASAPRSRAVEPAESVAVSAARGATGTRGRARRTSRRRRRRRSGAGACGSVGHGQWWRISVHDSADGRQRPSCGVGGRAGERDRVADLPRSSPAAGVMIVGTARCCRR